MGFRSQFESLAQFARAWASHADVLMVYGKEAFPAESKWPAPVLPQEQLVHSPRTLDERRRLAERFVTEFDPPFDVLVDDM